MRILITGAKGILGSSLVRILKDDFEIYGTSRNLDSHETNPTLRACDLGQRSEVEALVQSIHPDCIIHTAAKTNVDACEQTIEEAVRDNVLATLHICQEVEKIHARLLHISTDQIFDGKKKGPYLEEDTPHPLNCYGETKYRAEKTVQTLCPNAMILRTNFLSLNAGFLNWALKSLIEEKNIVGYHDIMFSPLYILDLVTLIRQLLNIQTPSGILNLCAKDGISKGDFILRLAKELGLDSSRVKINSYPESSNTARPKNMQLSATRLRQIIKKVPSIQDTISRIGKDFIATLKEKKLTPTQWASEF